MFDIVRQVFSCSYGFIMIHLWHPGVFWSNQGTLDLHEEKAFPSPEFQKDQHPEKAPCKQTRAPETRVVGAVDPVPVPLPNPLLPKTTATTTATTTESSGYPSKGPSSTTESSEEAEPSPDMPRVEISGLPDPDIDPKAPKIAAHPVEKTARAADESDETVIRVEIYLPNFTSSCLAMILQSKWAKSCADKFAQMPGTST